MINIKNSDFEDKLFITEGNVFCVRQNLYTISVRAKKAIKIKDFVSLIKRLTSDYLQGNCYYNYEVRKENGCEYIDIYYKVFPEDFFLKKVKFRVTADGDIYLHNKKSLNSVSFETIAILAKIYNFLQVAPAVVVKKRDIDLIELNLDEDNDMFN